MDTLNRFAVGVQGAGDQATLVLPLPIPRRLTRDEALNLAAYLVTLADPAGDEFPRLLKEIKET